MHRNYRRDLILLLAGVKLLPHRPRNRVLNRDSDLAISYSATILEGLKIANGASVSIGERSFLNVDCFIDASAPVTIGNHVLLGSRVSIITGTHDFGPPTHRGGTTRALPVVVEDGTWIGASVTILPGVTIHMGCIIAAGAVVAHDCPSDGLYAGVPARLIRVLSQ